MFRVKPEQLTEEFKPWDGDYEKTNYDVLLPDGTIVEGCWPNAGQMCSMDGSGRMWTPEEVTGIRFSINRKYL